MKKSNVLIAVVALVGLGLMGYAFLKPKKEANKKLDGTKILAEVKTLVKEPERLMLSPDNTNPGSLQLTYTFLTEAQEKDTAKELVDFTMKSYTKLLEKHPEVTSVSIVAFNPKLKKPMRVILGKDMVADNPTLLNSEKEFVDTMRRICPTSSPKDLKRFCNLSAFFYSSNP